MNDPERQRLVPDRFETVVSPGAIVLVCSDLHLGEVPTDASRVVTGELAERIARVEGPGVIVLNGDCFEMLAPSDSTIAGILDAHVDMRDALVAFAASNDRAIVVIPGVRDARLAWDRPAVTQLNEWLGAIVTLSVDLVFAANVDAERGQGEHHRDQVVRCEHGHRFDPYNAFVDPRDRHDSPLGQHLIQQIIPKLQQRRSFDDANAVADPDELADYLGSRLVYRLLANRAWWLLVPLLVALASRTSLIIGVLDSNASTIRSRQSALLVAVGLAIDLIALSAIVVGGARRVFSSVVARSSGPRAIHSNEPPRTAATALCGQGFAGFVTGHTHHPELRPVLGGFYANSGCGDVCVDAHRARLGLPPVFAPTLRRSWIELENARELEVRLVAAETPLRPRTRLERIVIRRNVLAPPSLTVVATLPGTAGWPLWNRSLQIRRRHERVRRQARMLVGATAFIGLASAITPPLRGRLAVLLDALPVELPQTAAASLVFGSAALLLLAGGLRRGQWIAWFSAVALLLSSAALNILKGVDVEEAILAVVAAGWLVHHRRAFTVRPDAHAMHRVMRLGGSVVAASMAAAVVLGHATGSHQRVQETLRALTERLAGDSALPLPSSSPFITPALSATGLTVLATLGYLLLRGRHNHPATAAEHHRDRERARRIVAAHGGDTLAYFALRDDKQWFFSGSSMVAYSVRNGACLVSPDPIGPPDEAIEVWSDFMSLADRNGWSVAVIGALPGWLSLYESAGMTAIYMGDEALIDCTAFTLDGGRMKSLRGAHNRLRKSGYTMSYHDPAHISPALAAELTELMTETRRGEAERGFSMTLSRLFDPEDVGFLLSVAHAPDGRAVGFCHWVPASDINGWSLDLMRRSSDPTLPNGITDFVVIETIRYARETHRWGLALNFAFMRAVVSGEREGPVSDLERRILRRFSDTMQIESLWKYNEKFTPYWRERYVVVDSVERMASQGIAIASAEGIAELPLVGRFLS